MPEFGARLLERIPRLEGVAKAVLYQRKNYGGGGYPHDDNQGEDLPLSARILRAVSDFVDVEERRGSRIVALEQLKLRNGWYDPKVLQALSDLYGQPGSAQMPEVPREVAIRDLQPGMVLTEDVKTRMGMLVACKGTRLLHSHVEKFQNFATLIGLQEPIRILSGGD